MFLIFFKLFDARDCKCDDPKKFVKGSVELCLRRTVTIGGNQVSNSTTTLIFPKN